MVANPHRNRTLVLNNKSEVSVFSAKENSPHSSPQSGVILRPEDTERVPQQSTSRWVTKRDRHMQLINSSVYDKETQIRNKAIEETRRQKALKRDQREKQKIERHLNILAARAGQSTSLLHEVSISGLRFQVADGGSKLVRIRGGNCGYRTRSFSCSQFSGANESMGTTPKHANVGGVTFLRSKNGNLYRAGIIRAKR